MPMSKPSNIMVPLKRVEPQAFPTQNICLKIDNKQIEHTIYYAISSDDNTNKFADPTFISDRISVTPVSRLYLLYLLC